MTDLEVSTFKKRPAYRYIRGSDRVPQLGTEDGIARVKLFNPTGIGTWYISEYDPETRTAFGLADLGEPELGYFDMQELTEFRGRFGLPLERDLFWKIRPLKDCKGESK